MRWLLLKDLRILRRSPLLVGLLVAYPIVLAVLIGLALSGGPEKPKVAFANLVPEGRTEVSIGGDTIDTARYASELFKAIDPIRVDSRDEAIEKVRSGEALGALVIPSDITERLQAAINLAGGPPPAVEVLYNAEDPLKRQFVEQAIESRLSDANRALSGRLTEIAAQYIGIIVAGGDFSLLGQEVNVLGLRRSEAIINAALGSLPEGAPERVALEQVARFARLASDNLDISKPILASIGEPVRVRQTVIDGDRTPLDAFAAAVAVVLSLSIVTLLLGAGMLALEREEHALGRLLRGLASRGALVAEKIGLAALCGTVVSAILLVGLAAFVGFEWGRAPLWLAAIILAALAFGAMGVVIGVAARDVRAASLLAFMTALPLTFLALVPSGSVAPWLFEVISAISAAFPFKPALEALDAAISGGRLGGPLAHLAALTLVFGLVSRVALRRLT
jgi:ABC-2 type transport system permease protein